LQPLHKTANRAKPALFTKVRQTAEEQNFYEAAAGEDEKIAADVYRPIISIYALRPVSMWTKP